MRQRSILDLRHLDTLKKYKRRCSMVSIYCRLFVFKKKTDFTPHVTVFMQKGWPDNEIGGNPSSSVPAASCQNLVIILTSCTVSDQTLSFVILKVAVDPREGNRILTSAWTKFTVTHHYPPQSVRIPLESWPLVQFLARHGQLIY